MSNEYALVAEGLEKHFGETHALRGLNLQAQRGTVLGVLGPNGAGKTTAVRILTTLLKPDAGTATVAGIDVVKRPDLLRSRIALTGQYAAVDEFLTGFENLDMVGRLYHLPRAFVKQRATELLERFDLMDAAKRPVKTYSGGMRRRLDLAASLMASPEILFLDEPTTGLDPRSRIAVWEVVRELVTAGTTVVLTTQYLEEADQLADRIAVVDKGRVIAEGTADELKLQVGGERIDVTVASDAIDAAVRVLTSHGSSEARVEQQHRRVTVPVRNGAQLLAVVVRDLDEAGVIVDDFGLRRPTLDDVFLSLTGHAAEDSEDADGDDDSKELKKKKRKKKRESERRMQKVSVGD